MICNPFEPTSKMDCKTIFFCQSSARSSLAQQFKQPSWPIADWGTLLERRLTLGLRIQISWHWVRILFDTVCFKIVDASNPPDVSQRLLHILPFSGHMCSFIPSVSLYIYNYTYFLYTHNIHLTPIKCTHYTFDLHMCICIYSCICVNVYMYLYMYTWIHRNIHRS